MNEEDRIGRIIVCTFLVLQAARNFSRAMAEFDGNLEYCGEALNEVIDAADRLIELEAMEP